MNSYEPQASDTTEAIDRLVFEGFRAMSPRERLELARKACHAVERMSIAGLRLRYPNASDDELRKRAGAKRLGPELTRLAFGVEAEAWLE
ncbi:MAG TPA: hypothetical protein PKE00_09010 [Planctomycetota bacterium]|nr:hypothetical protein [Planctomycetota bacterium]